MKYLKTVAKTIGIMTLVLLLFTLLITGMNYINMIGKKTITVLEIICPIITLFIGGFLMGKVSKQKGWLEGLKIAFIFIVLIILFNYLGLRNHLELKNLIYYLILTITCIFGSMIGINKNKELEKNR